MLLALRSCSRIDPSCGVRSALDNGPSETVIWGRPKLVVQHSHEGESAIDGGRSRCGSSNGRSPAGKALVAARSRGHAGSPQVRVAHAHRSRRPGGDAVRGEGLRLAPVVRMGGRPGPAGVSPRFLGRHPQGVPVPARAAGGVQRPGPLPPAQGMDGDVALAAVPPRHGHRPDHRRPRHIRRLRHIHICRILRRARALRRGLHVTVAQPGVDDDGHPRLFHRQPDGAPGP